MSISDIPDGNTAALRAHEAAEARAEKRWKAYGEAAIKSVIEDVLEGRVLRNVNPLPPRDVAPGDFIEDVAEWIDADTLATLITGHESVIESLLVALHGRLERKVRDWCENADAGRNLVGRIIDSLDEDARSGE